MSSRVSLKLKVDFDTIVGFLYFSISNLSRMLLHFLGIPREITYGLYMILLALYILKYIPRLKMFDVIYYMITITIVSVGLVKYSKYIDSNSRIYAILFLFLPSYLFFKFYDREKMVKVFIASQYYAIVYLLIYYIVDVRFQSKYSMDYGYWISIPICTIAFLYIAKRRTIDLIMVLIAIVTLLLSGNRGGLILSFICILYYYVFSDENQNKGKKWIVRNLIIGLSIILVISTANLWIGYIGKFSGMSRTIQKFVQGDLLTSRTRERLYARVTALIADRKNGYGPLASRMLLTEPYPHSLIYEMQMDYGVAIGTVLSVTIILMSILNLLNYRKSELRLIIGFIELVGIGSLMVSSSYYYEIYVPATIALFISYTREIDGNGVQLLDNAEYETTE